MAEKRDLTPSDRWKLRHVNPKFRVTCGACKQTFTDGKAALAHMEYVCDGKTQPSLFDRMPEVANV